MKICATYGVEAPLSKEAEMQEIRLDVFDKIPADAGADSIVTLCGRPIESVPETFSGLVDVGEADIVTSHRIIRSVHDFERTPDKDEILSMLNTGDQEVTKGAFMASSFTDLHNILSAASEMKRPHVLLGMGEMGQVTRIRQSVLGNEFTFGYVGKSTAPGQFSAGTLSELGDDCSIVGLIGHPLGHSRSAAMQNAAMKDKSINGIYLNFDSPDLAHVADVIRGYNIRGVNVTIPYKQKIIPYLNRITETARMAGAVNTVVNQCGILVGDNTDVIGIRYALSGIDLKGKKILIMGSGGAARAALQALSGNMCKIYVSGRNADTVRQICAAFGAKRYSGPAARFDLVINCTPIGIVDGNYPSDITEIDQRTAVFDMVYGKETPLMSLARSKGCKVIDGSDMLVAQGAASFHLWFGEDPDLDVMRKAIL